MKLNNIEHDDEDSYNDSKNSEYDYELIKDPLELSNIKIKLINSKALCSKFSPEQLEYNYVRQINSSLNMKQEFQGN